jgi:predicted O-methyltransferase YrrM
MHEPEFTVNWVGNNPKFWDESLSHLKGKQVLGLELGSYEGRSAIWFVQNILTHPDSRLICVDQFTGDYAERYYSNIVVSGVHRKIKTIKGDTHETVKVIHSKLDFAYIDADHKAWSVVSDIAMVWPLLKVGGVLIMDDYEHPDYDCKVGIDFFLQMCKDRYELLRFGWQVIVKKLK